MDLIIRGFAGLILLAIPAYFIGRMVWRNKRVETAQTWPTTDATVQTGERETVGGGRYRDVVLPCFAFSYVVAGEYYSGRFALLSTRGADNSLIRCMKGRVFKIHYNSEDPATYFIPGEQMEGCDIEQRLSDRLVNLYPKD